MNARKPEPRPRLTYTHWPAARPPARTMASPPRRHQRDDDLPADEDREASADEPGYGHGV